MKNYFIGFFSANIVWFILLTIVDIPEYIVYDCADISWYSNAPENVISFCSQKNTTEKVKT